METKIIKFSNKKFVLWILGGGILVVLGILFTIFPYKFTTILVKNILLIRFIGIIAVLFFGFVFITLIRKVLFDKNLGIIINEKGIFDNSSFVAVGLIKWEDIISIKKSNVGKTSFLLIDVKNPENYIKTSSKIKSNLLKANYRSYGTPISISSNFINCDFDQLEEYILDGFKLHKTSYDSKY